MKTFTEPISTSSCTYLPQNHYVHVLLQKSVLILYWQDEIPIYSSWGCQSLLWDSKELLEPPIRLILQGFWNDVKQNLHCFVDDIRFRFLRSLNLLFLLNAMFLVTFSLNVTQQMVMEEADWLYGSDPSPEHKIALKEAIVELILSYHIEQNFRKQKGACRWAVEGKRNTKFFHSSVKTEVLTVSL